MTSRVIKYMGSARLAGCFPQEAPASLPESIVLLGIRTCSGGAARNASTYDRLLLISRRQQSLKI